MKFNKKGAALSGTIEIMLFIVLFLAVIAIIGISLNSQYSENQDLTMGISSNKTMTNLQEYQRDLDSAYQNGSTSFSDFGILKLTTIPRMVSLTTSIIFSFVTGDFINSVVRNMNLGAYASLVIIIFKILYYVIILMIILSTVTRSNT